MDRGGTSLTREATNRPLLANVIKSQRSLTTTLSIPTLASSPPHQICWRRARLQSHSLITWPTSAMRTPTKYAAAESRHRQGSRGGGRMNPEVQLTAALAAIDKAAAKSSDSRLVAAKCRGLMHGYHARWKDAGYESLAVEVVIHKNLTNPATWRSSRTFTLAGKLDVIAHYAGRTVIVDHKTTSEDIADPNATYWQQLAVEGQVNQYMLLAWMDGCKADNALWDVIRKPDIRPRKMTKAERGHVVATGKWFEREVSDDERQEIAAGGDTESLAMYEGRLAHDCTVERPERYFQRRMVPRLDGEIIEYAAEVWEHSQEMIAAAQRAKETQRLPPRNSGACLLYGSPCSFLGICSGHDTPDSERWQRKAEVHREQKIGRA